MRTALVVEPEVAFQALSSLGDGLVGMQVNLLVLDAFPEPFDEDIPPAEEMAQLGFPHDISLGTFFSCNA